MLNFQKRLQRGKFRAIEQPRMRWVSSSLVAAYAYVVPWSEFSIVPSYPHYPQAPLRSGMSLLSDQSFQGTVNLHDSSKFHHHVYGRQPQSRQGMVNLNRSPNEVREPSPGG